MFHLYLICFVSLLTAKFVACKNSDNPFIRTQNYYVNPVYQAELQTSINSATSPAKETMETMLNVPSAYWIDVKAKLRGNSTTSLEGILKDAAQSSSQLRKQLLVFIVYDLPNRDCNAKATNGEICCTYNADGTCDYKASGDCSAGLTEYQTQYIDPFFDVIKPYTSQLEIVLVIEPDSLPNLATNQDNPSCGNTATTTAYEKGIAYAINKFSDLPVSMYLDAAHGGWLGWEDNMNKFVSTVNSMDFPITKLRGFSTNVANYQTIGEMCPWMNTTTATRNDYCLNSQHQNETCCADPCKLESQYNQGNNELNYVQALSYAFKNKQPLFNPHFIVDSGRNGVADMRDQCSNWCNIRGAGVGQIPTADTASPDFVDAYFWLKTPGESDGCTQELPDGSICPRFDSMCSSTDSIGSKGDEPRAPEAGAWFDYQIKQLATNAVLYPSTKVTRKFH